MLKLIFHSAYDGPVAPLLPVGGARSGSSLAGPQTLLGAVETCMGLGSVEHAYSERLAAYRETLSQMGAGRFYARSLANAPLAVAGHLLALREEWAISSGDLSDSPNLSPRLRDLFAAERAFRQRELVDSLFRRRRLEAALAREKRVLPLAVEMRETIEEMPPRIRWLLRALQDAGVAVEHRSPPYALDQDNNLSRLRAALFEGRQSKLQAEDDSLLLLESPDETTAADFLARSLGDWAPVLLAPAEESAPGLAWRALGRPWPQAAERRRARPVLQLLPLVCELLWDPVDPYVLYDYLTLPISPLPASLRYDLARMLMRQPGAGGAAWTERLFEFAGIPADPETPEGRWLPRFGRKREDGLEAKTLRAQLDQLQQWAQKRLHNAADQATADDLAALATAARDMKALLNGDAAVSPAALAELVRHVMPDGFGANPSRAGAPEMIHDPLAIDRPLDTLIWWNCTAECWGSVSPSFFTAAEHKVLRDRGFEIESPIARAARLVRSWEHPLRMSQRLILVRPHSIAGQAQSDHPVISRLRAAFGDLTAVRHVLRYGERTITIGAAPEIETVSARKLPEQVAALRFAPAPVRRREIESPSSLEKLFFRPEEWFMKYILQFHRDQWPNGAILSGTVLHALCEGDLEPDQLSSRLENLLRESYAQLLLPGRAHERNRLEQLAHDGSKALDAMIRAGGWRRDRVEHKVEFKLGDQRLAGRIDLLLRNDAGQPAILDLKLGGDSKRRRELRDAGQVQLALYAAGIQQQEHLSALPSAAYFIFTTARTISDARGLFPRAFELKESTLAEALARTQTALGHRLAQIHVGQLPLAPENKKPGPDWDKTTMPPWPQNVYPDASYDVLLGRAT